MRNPLLLFCTVVVVSCEPSSLPPTTSIAVVIDRSNEHLVQTLADDAREIIKACGLEQDPWRGVDFRLAFISDVSYNPTKELHLPAESEADGNIIVRRHRVRAFEKEIEQLLRLYATQRERLDGSVVYPVIANELSLLAHGHAEHCTLIAYTDLLDHGPGLSFYVDSIIDSVRTYPQVFIEYFERIRSLDRLDDITVAIANVPKNLPNSERVSTVYGLYERMIRAHGGQVSINGNFIHHDR